MNYDKIFEEDIDKTFFYNESSYPTRKLIDGFISLNNAEKRLFSKNEYYTLLHYQGEQDLPNGYIPLDDDVVEKMGFGSDEHFATIDPNLTFEALCQNGGIQLISGLPCEVGNARYLLGPGPDEITLSELVHGQLEEYKNEKSHLKSR